MDHNIRSKKGFLCLIQLYLCSLTIALVTTKLSSYPIFVGILMKHDSSAELDILCTKIGGRKEAFYCTNKKSSTKQAMLLVKFRGSSTG